jgi:hypothetical protein
VTRDIRFVRSRGEKRLKQEIFTRLFVATLALCVVTSLTGCGGGSGSETLNTFIHGSDSDSEIVSPDAFISPVTRQYEGTWSGFYYGSNSELAVAYLMELNLTPDGKITGTQTDTFTQLTEQLNARMTSDNSFAGTLKQGDSVFAIFGTLRLEEGRLIGEYRRDNAFNTVTSFRLQKK